MNFRHCLYAQVFLYFCLIGVLGCGKKIKSENKESQKAPSLQPVLAEEEKFLSRQQVLCEDRQNCPESILKIVAFENRTPRVCTGFLINKDTVVTSSTCLPKVLRLKDQNCSTDIFFFLPETAMQKAQRVGCDKVLFATDPQGDDPSLWRDDIAFLKINSILPKRNILHFSKLGVEAKENYNLLGVEQIDGEIGLIRRQKCLAIYNSFINPLASSQFSPIQVFSDCDFKEGFRGAPAIDDSGKVRSILSSPMSSKFKSYILSTGLATEGLKPIIHATTAACVQATKGFQIEQNKECSNEISEKTLSDARNKLLTDDSFFKEKLKKTEDFLESSNIFLKFKVEVESFNDIKTFIISPWCFKNLSSWIFRVNPSRGNYGFALEMPQIKMKRILNAFGEIGVESVMDSSEDIFVEFSIKNLKKIQTSVVYFWKEFGSPRRFEAISTKCL